MNKIEIDDKYLPAIGRIFTPVVMDSIALNGHSAYLSEVCSNCGILQHIDSSMSLGQFFDFIYDIIFKKRRNEYIYKNAIANKILLGKHSLNTSHMLTEFRAGRCKADVVVVNGTSTVYEIKSELDSFNRLENQIQAYLKVFDHTNVITSVSKADKLKTLLPNAVGILALTNRNTITTVRKSKSNKKNIDQGILFDSLRKTEYLKVVEKYFKTAPDVPNTVIYKECRKLFYKIPPEIAHDLTIKILKNRRKTKILREFIKKAPSSLSAYAMTICNEKPKMLTLLNAFSSSIGSTLFPESIQEEFTCITHISGANNSN